MPMFVATLSSSVLAAGAVLRRRVEAFRNWHAARQGYVALCDMDDRALSDVGLTRSDLRDATASGYFGDPTVLVAARAAERHGHRRSTHVGSLPGPSVVPDIDAALARMVPSM